MLLKAIQKGTEDEEEDVSSLGLPQGNRTYWNFIQEALDRTV
jgi:hypothetical protein